VVPSEYLIIIIIIIIIINVSEMILNEKREKTCLLIDIAVADVSYVNTMKQKNQANTDTWISLSAGCGK
jgi:glutamine amidotransferase-like uncharacterized protein